MQANFVMRCVRKRRRGRMAQRLSRFNQQQLSQHHSVWGYCDNNKSFVQSFMFSDQRIKETQKDLNFRTLHRHIFFIKTYRAIHSYPLVPHLRVSCLTACVMGSGSGNRSRGSASSRHTNISSSAASSGSAPSGHAPARRTSTSSSTKSSASAPPGYAPARRMSTSSSTESSGSASSSMAPAQRVPTNSSYVCIRAGLKIAALFAPVRL